MAVNRWPGSIPGMGNSPSTLAERLIAARTSRGFGQDVVAKLAKMSQQSYSDLERGKSKGTTRIGSLAHVLGVDAYWLETGIERAEGHQVAEVRPEYLSPDLAKLIELLSAMAERKRKALLQFLEG